MPTRLLLALLTLVCACPSFASAEEPVRFNRDIRQILADKCFACHGPDENTREAELRFDQEEAVFADADQTIIVRGKPADSELVARITHDDPDMRMPPAESKKSLTAKEIALLTRWIAEGAKWEGHWAYIPPQVSAPAATADRPIDALVNRRLAAAKLTPVEQADPVTLVRRLYFDLIGLPPPPAVVQAFAADPSDEAYQQLVDDLLASQHFGERMAIYWLDVVRYADSNGYHSDEPRSIAPYREYAIESFNKNKPYDQFVIEQLAGDLLPAPTDEQRVASGFNMLLQTTSEGGAQAKEYLAKYSADRVRNTAQIFLGATLGCAECHDHKFDPYTAKDFYSFAAFFADIQERGVGNPPAYPVVTSLAKSRLDEIDQQVKALQAKLNVSTPELEKSQVAWEASLANTIAGSVELGTWHMIGPFTAANFDAAHATVFPPEKEIDLAKSYDKLAWKERSDLADGTVHNLPPTANSATYFYRTARVAAPTKLNISLGSDDSFVIWVNGKKVGEAKVARAVAADQNQVSADLIAGENTILLKVANGGGGHGFYFNAGKVEIPGDLLAILKLPAAQRNDAQRNKLAAHYRTIAPELAATRDQIAKLEAERKQVNDSLPKTLMTKAGDPRMIRLLPRGNWMRDDGEPMQPAIPAFLGKLDTGDRRANRLDLAQWIVSRDNPLTARTFVNRLWKIYFGHGLATPLDDLGAQGTEPTHPDLLDWLAIEFMESGWDTKHIVREIVMSDTYRRSSTPTVQLKQADPYNQLYARQSRFRLDAELVRDNALEVSGLLVHTLGGRSVKPYQPAGYWRHMNFPARTWQADTGDNLYRRSLYTWWQRMFLHPAMLAFDAPSREECTVERPRSNTPQQALVLLNDPTYVEAARALATRMLSEGGASFDQRVDWAYRQALSRSIRPEELAVLTQLFEKHSADYQAQADAAGQLIATGASDPPKQPSASELAAYTSVARVILNLHETITRR